MRRHLILFSLLLVACTAQALVGDDAPASADATLDGAGVIAMGTAKL